MKGIQCYELFGGIALKNHTFSFSFSSFIVIFLLLEKAPKNYFGLGKIDFNFMWSAKNEITAMV